MEEVIHIPRRKTAPGTRCHCPMCDDRYYRQLKARNAARRKVRANASSKRLNVQPLYSLVLENPGLSNLFPVGTSWNSWQKYGIDPYLAGKICISIGLHPYEVFGEEWLEKAVEEEVQL